MSNVIRLIEKLGQDSALRNANSGELEQTLLDAHVDPAIRAAILACDQAQLEKLLGANTNVCCVVAPARDDDDDVPSKEEEISMWANQRNVAKAS
jgi:hypothetical protein